MTRYPKIAATALCLVAAASAQAVPVTLSFVVSGFQSYAPVQTVVGSLTYEAASITSTISSMTSVAMTIDGHAYTLSEVGFSSPWGGSGDYDYIYGSVNGVGVSAGTNDFGFSINRITGDMGGRFTYTTTGFTTQGYQTIYEGFGRTTRTTNTGTRVPEPATWALAALGLAAAAFGRRRAA